VSAVPVSSAAGAKDKKLSAGTGCRRAAIGRPLQRG